jgi:superfamily I DNA/RNA helicase
LVRRGAWQCDTATSGILKVPEPQPVAADLYAHPDAQRRFRVIENLEALEAALEFPWEKWAVFLHPAQRSVVERDFSGPARVAGSAGTGKTVVALHRVVRILRHDRDARVLLTTFSEPLANALSRKLMVLAADHLGLLERVTVASFRAIAEELHMLAFGRKAHIASRDLIRSLVLKAAEAEGVTVFSEQFLLSEWRHVVDAWQLEDEAAYAEVPRMGRRLRLGARQRAVIWPVFERVRRTLKVRGYLTPATMFATVSAHYAQQEHKPLSHIVVDEAQDLGVPELRFLAALAPNAPNALLFAGDLGQRIFQPPFSWKGLGIDVRGRSSTLKVNYRTSHQIRTAADRLLPKSVRDVDGLEDERAGTVSVFNGPPPQVVILADEVEEREVVARFITSMIAEGVEPSEISLFVRTPDELPRDRAAAAKAGVGVTELTGRNEGEAGRISIGTMHFAKGLEFKAVAVMACDEEVVPSAARLAEVSDEMELDDVYATERQLFYVAATRARDWLLVTGVAPGSEFLEDLHQSP